MNDENLAGYDELEAANRPVAEGAARVAAVSVPEMKSLLGLAVGAVVIGAIYFGRTVLIPITLAVMVSFLLSPIVNFMQRVLRKRALAVILTMIGALGFFGIMLTLLGSEAATLTTDAPRYAKTIEGKILGLQAYTAARVAFVTNNLGHQSASQSSSAAVSSPISSGSTTVSTSGGQRAVLVEVASQAPTPLTVAKTIVQPILDPLKTFIIVFVVTVFILLQKEDLRERFIRLFGTSDLHRTTLALDDAGKRLSRYFLSQLAVNTSFGIVIGIGLWMIGIPSPALWGVLAGLLRFVPYVGSFLAALAPMALGAAVDPGWTMAIYAGLLFLIVEPLTGYAVEPLLYGLSTGLSPVSVIVSAVFWAWMWGPIGLIISTPLTLCFVVLGRNVKSLEFFDVLLGDRPALSAEDTFYQRILGTNCDDAFFQAETFLSDRQLVDYYDAIAVKGLRLAAEDERRGTINREQATNILGAMRSVMDDLHERNTVPTGDDTIAAAVSTDGGSVACIAGGGTFDPAVATMLVQVLREEKVTAAAFGYERASRANIAELDMSNITVVALTYLELSESPAQARYLIKRLRQRAPHVAVVVGLCDADEAMLNNPHLQLTIGADKYASSLNEVTKQIKALLSVNEL